MSQLEVVDARKDAAYQLSWCHWEPLYESERVQPVVGRPTAERVQPVVGRPTAERVHPVVGRPTAERVQPVVGRPTAIMCVLVESR